MAKRHATPTTIGRLLRAAACGALFVAAFALTARRLTPPYSSDPILSAKMAYFEQHRDEYDVVFFGSSRVYRAFDPATFAVRMRHAGHDLRAFNFGVGGMRPHELDALLRRLLTPRPARLRYVCIELMEWHPPVLDELRGHDRTPAWHTPRETLAACRTVWLTESSWRARLAAWRRHLEWMCARATNFGEGPRWVASWQGPDPRHTAHLQRIAAGHGFVAVDSEVGPRYEQRRRLFLQENLVRFRRQVARIDEQNAAPGSLQRFNVAAQTAQQAALRRLGIEPIYVIPNLRWGTPEMNRLAAEGHLEHVLAFNRPQLYAALYREDHYFDRGHLNRRGATEFTKLLADQFAARLTVDVP